MQTWFLMWKIFAGFPVAIEIGQFQAACPKYKSRDLLYLPLRTTGQDRLVGPVHSQMFDDPEFEESDEEMVDLDAEAIGKGFNPTDKKVVRDTRFGLSEFSGLFLKTSRERAKSAPPVGLKILLEGGAFNAFKSFVFRRKIEWKYHDVLRKVLCANQFR